MKTLLGDSEAVRGAAARIGSHPVDELGSTRLATHFALQAVAAVGFTLAPARDDYRHTVQSWNRARRRFEGVTTPDGLVAALDPTTATLSLHTRERELEILSLPGRTLDDAYAWMQAAIARHRGDAVELVRPAHDLPDHPLAHGEPFPEPRRSAAAELAAWFELADAVLDAAHVPDATVPCIWPHHFDMATLVDLGASKSIGLGLSPGDASYAAPYFYVNLWPHPDANTELPALPSGGHWHTQGWTGAVLTSTALLQSRDRVQAIDAWIVTAYDVSRDLL